MKDVCVEICGGGLRRIRPTVVISTSRPDTHDHRATSIAQSKQEIHAKGEGDMTIGPHT